MVMQEVASHAEPARVSLLQAVRAQQWDPAAIYLTALGNSRLPTHATSIRSILMEKNLPSKLRTQARDVLQLIAMATEARSKSKDPEEDKDKVQDYSKRYEESGR